MMNVHSFSPGMTEEARGLELLLENLAPETCRAYRRAWGDYAAYCRSNGFDPLRVSDDLVARYAYGLFHDQGLSAATVLHRLSVVAGVFRCAGLWILGTSVTSARRSAIFAAVAGTRRSPNPCHRVTLPKCSPSHAGTSGTFGTGRW